MAKPIHRSVKFSKEEMELDIPNDLDLEAMPSVGRGKAGMELAMRISRARGEEKRKLIESLSHPIKVQLEPDVATVFKDSPSVNKALRALIHALPEPESKSRRKTA